MDTLARRYDEFGRHWAHDTSPLYEDWATGIAADPVVLDLLRPLRYDRSQPNLVFAAARWVGAPLAPYAQWRGWLIDSWDAVHATILERTTQTNEAGRCATWLPPLSRIDGPVALLEVGAAAGLCLFPDRYSVDYDTPEGTCRIDPADGPSTVLLRCRLDSVASVPERMPDVIWRRGIDLSPIDPSDRASIDWLATLVWPGTAHDDRVARLRAAAAVAAAERPEIVQGDLLELLDDVAAEAPPHATLVVFHSAVLLYLDAAQRRTFADLVGGLGERLGRPVVWLSNETVGTLPEIDARVPVGAGTSHRFVQTQDALPIAFAGQHGALYETLPFGAARPPRPAHA